MAVILAGGCRVSDMREGEPLVNGTLRVWHPIGRATGAQAISLRVMEFAPGLSPTIQNEDCDQILYVVDALRSLDAHGAEYSSRGQAQSAPPLNQSSLSSPHPEGVRRNDTLHICIDRHGYDIGSDTGIYIRPNQTLAIDNPGPDSIVMISSQCPDPDRTPRFVERAASSDSPRLDQPPIVRLAEQR